MPSPHSRFRLVAVDTNVLLDLAADCEDVFDAVATIRVRVPNTQLIVTPTVILELAEIARRDMRAETRKAARAALGSIRTQWGFNPMNLVPVGHGIVEQIATRLLELGLLPHEERHDALILAESALLGCSILLSSDEHLRAIDHRRASIELRAVDVEMPIIAAPREIVRKFFRT